MNKYLTIAGAAKHLGVAPNTIYWHMRAGRLKPCGTVDGRPVFDPDTLELPPPAKHGRRIAKAKKRKKTAKR